MGNHERTERWFRAISVALVISAVSALVYLYSRFGSCTYTPEGREYLASCLDGIIAAAGPAAPLAYFAFFTLWSLFLPVSPLTATGALVFGKYVGFICSFSGEILGSTIAFFLARHLLLARAERMKKHEKLKVLVEKAEKKGFSVVFYLRIFWCPLMILNYGAGATRISYRSFLAATVLGTLPTLFFENFFFGGVRRVATLYESPYDLLAFDLVFPPVFFAVSFFLPKILRKAGLLGQMEAAVSPSGNGKKVPSPAESDYAA